MNVIETIKIMEDAVKNGKRLSKKEAWDLMRKATENDEDLAMVWKIPNKVYEKWYNEHKKYLGTTLEEETTYLVHSGEKAFDGSKGGYSIFAISLGMLIRDDRFNIDRIEHSGCEWAIIIDLK